MAASGLKLKTLPAVTVSTAGTAVPLHSSVLQVYAVTITSLSSNTGTQYLGDSTVIASNGTPFAAGETIEVETPAGAKGVDQFDVSKIYLNSSTNGAEFRVVVWIRE